MVWAFYEACLVLVWGGGWVVDGVEVKGGINGAAWSRVV